MQEVLGLGECEDWEGNDLSSLRITAGSLILASRSLFWGRVVLAQIYKANFQISRHMVTNDVMFMYIMPTSRIHDYYDMSFFPSFVAPETRILP